MVDLQFLHKFHGAFLKLYPSAYRDEYADEQQVVFRLSLEDAAEQGKSELAKVVLKEFANLPAAILQEHLRERRKKKMAGKFASRFDLAPGSRKEAFLALAPFLFGMVMTLLSTIGKGVTVPLWIQIAFVLLFWSSVLGMFLLGSARGLPRWFLPYLGLPLPIISLLIFNALIDPKWPGFRISWLVDSFLMEGFLWSGMIVLLILFVLISAWVGKFRPFYQRIRQDWTLLSFLVYGTAPLVLFITFNEYKNIDFFFFLSLLMLVIGGWFYLRSDDPWKRFSSLFIGLWLSMGIAAAGKAIRFEESWPMVTELGWGNEMIYTLVTWTWLAIILFIPYLLNFLPAPKDSLPAPQN